jgi:acetolactate synthase-1/2/3 large subunit
MNLRAHGAEWLAAADVILTVDAAVPWVPRRASPSPDAMVIHLGADPAYASYAYRDFRASRLIAGSSKAGLQMLIEALDRLHVDQQRIDSRRKRIALTESGGARRSRIVSARSAKPVDAG